MSAAHGTSEGHLPAVPGYEVEKLLGVGGMGRVYLARQQALKRLVCVKVLSIPEGEDADLCRARFGREAELLASVSHPHILSVFDYGTTADANLPFLVTEYIEGGDLRKRMSAGKAMPVERVRSLLVQIGEALEFLHSRGIIHRDLKPENVLLPTDLLCKVGDFGLAVMQDSAGSLTRSGRGLGTVGYVSPEQQYGLKVDERADQYSLAALGYELLTGRRPLGRFLPPSKLNPSLPAELDPVILRGLAEEPRARFTSVHEFMAEMERHLYPSRRSRLGLRLAAVGVLLFLILAAGMRAVVVGLGSDKGLTASALSGRIKPPPRSGWMRSREPCRAGSRRPRLHRPLLLRSSEYKRLTELRAYRIWHERGRPQGKAGEAVKEKNWIDAETQIDAEVKARAYKIWEQQGCPTGPEGDAVREKNLHAAEVQLLKETEEEFRRRPIP